MSYKLICFWWCSKVNKKLRPAEGYFSNCPVTFYSGRLRSNHHCVVIHRMKRIKDSFLWTLILYARKIYITILYTQPYVYIIFDQMIGSLLEVKSPLINRFPFINILHILVDHPQAPWQGTKYKLCRLSGAILISNNKTWNPYDDFHYCTIHHLVENKGICLIYVKWQFMLPEP